MSTPHASDPTHANRLSLERSPYLLQHAHNPVDWYPWGAEAFARARVEDKPIFLSIGYSACHWCHVMERESFENEAVAALLNERFVSIKVDREERPDVDEVYMTAVQMLTGSGGWPMSMFLLPDGRPFYGGTYYTPETRQGRIGFTALITQLADAYAGRRAEVEESADGIVGELRKAVRQRPVVSDTRLDPFALLSAAVSDLSERFDAVNGGFGGAPKFPPHHALRLLTLAARSGNEDAAPLLITTLDRMALGGIYDQIGGGFHRYATDAVWLLPHFEKMLYDNALLARVYAEAFDLTGNAAYGRIAHETCDWVLRDLLDAAGGFHAALDADSEGEEGKYYVWTQAEATAILGPEGGEAFGRTYHFVRGGNFRDEATGHSTGANIPYLGLGAAANRVPVALDAETAKQRAAMLARRYGRVPPGKDDKVITAWNGLMIGALATSGRILSDAAYLTAARHAADFCRNMLTNTGGALLRRYARGEAGLPAYLDDYAFLADGLLDLYEATGDTRDLSEARRLAEAILDRFADPEDQAFFYTASDHETLIARTKDLFDGALPSANGVALRVLARLGTLSGGERYRRSAEKALRAYQGFLSRAPQGTPTMIEAAVLMATEVAVREPVSLRVEHPSPVVGRRGETLHLSFTLSIDSGYHVNSRTPLSSELIATTATILSDAPAAVGPATYPPAQSIDAAGETLKVYIGEAGFVVPLTFTVDAAAGDYEIILRVRCQPCSDNACLAPRELSATAKLRVVTGTDTVGVAGG
jgi:uncharacterized protein YyaL (SSP411 family)